MPYTEADLTAVRAEMAKPASVRFADRSTDRRSMAELQALEARILTDLARTAARPRQFVAVGSKGF